MVRMREKEKIDYIKSKVTKENALELKKYAIELFLLKCCKKKDEGPPPGAIEANGHNQNTM